MNSFYSHFQQSFLLRNNSLYMWAHLHVSAYICEHSFMCQPHPIPHIRANTAQKMKFSIKDFLSKCNRIHSFLRIWSHLLRKSLMQNLIFCAMQFVLSEWSTKVKSVKSCKIDMAGLFLQDSFNFKGSICRVHDRLKRTK